MGDGRLGRKMPTGVEILRTLTRNLLSNASRGSGRLEQEYMKHESSDWQPGVAWTELGAKKHGLRDPAGAGKFADTTGGLGSKNEKKSTRMEPWRFGQVSIFNWAQWMQKQEEVLGA